MRLDTYSFFSIGCALFLNALFIYAIQDLPVQPSTKPRAFYEVFSQEEEKVSKEENKNRQEQLKQSSSAQEAIKATDQKVKELSKQKEPQIRNVNVKNIKSLEPVSTLASSDSFNFDVEYAQDIDGEYLFRARFYPKERIKFKRIRQNFYFVLDRSHSIGKQRYQLAKSAVLDALTQLEKGDTFNILVFDDHVVRLSNENLPATEEAFAYAIDWLSKQTNGGLFAGTELYTSLGQIIPKVVADEEVHTAILFSDGNTVLSREKQRSSISGWTQSNQGKVALFAVAVGRDNNIALLDLLTSMNKGNLFYSSNMQETQAITRRLIEEIGRPIGKDLHISALSKASPDPLILYPKQNRLSDLYENRPLIVMGKVKKLSPLYLFVQGRYYDNWLDIEKEVLFQNAQQVAYADLDRSWTLHQVNDVYDAYLQDGSLSRLSLLRRMLMPLKLQSAFR